PTISHVNDKDIRSTTFVRNSDGSLSINTDGGLPNRIRRNLKEINLVNKLDFIKKHKLFDNAAQLKFGGLYSFKQRDYSIPTYQIMNLNVNTRDLNGDPNQILAPGNIWTPESNAGYYFSGRSQPQNEYDATQHTIAA